MKLRQMFVVILLFLPLMNLGCGSITIESEPVAKSTPTTYYEYYDGWGYGFGGQGQADLHRACPQDRVARIRNYYSLEDTLMALLTSGIYTSHTSAITCAEGSGHAKNN